MTVVRVRGKNNGYSMPPPARLLFPSTQIAFSDGTKILLSGDGDLVTLIHADGEKEQETISFAKALEDER